MLMRLKRFPLSNVRIKPIFLLADSQLLFHEGPDGLFIDRIRRCFDGDIVANEVKASYIGASNGDDPRFYQIFKDAFRQVGVTNCRMIRVEPDVDDTIFLRDSNIFLLSGGDTTLGWRAIKRNGWDRALIQKYQDGAVLMGISAGAIQLGRTYYDKDIYSDPRYLQLIDYIVDAHPIDQWRALKEEVAAAGHGAKGIGIPHGAGLVYNPDGSLEAIRFPCPELFNVKGHVNMRLLDPLEYD